MFVRESYYLYKILRQWRYTPEKKRELQFFFLKGIVKHAYERNRFYRRLYDRAGFHPRQLESLADLERIPVVRKANILKGRELFYDARSLAASRVLYTSGSTGDPFRVYLDEEASDYSGCIFLRTLMDQGYNPLAPLGFYWYREERNSLFTRLGVNRKVIFSPHDTPEDQLARIKKHKLKYLYYFPFKLYELANAYDTETIQGLGVKRIFTVGELLAPRMRAFFEKRFGCTVTDNYGLTEFNIAAYQKLGEAHYTVNDDSVLFETREAEGSLLPGRVRKPVLTSFFNYVTPFIRYEMDDRIEISPRGHILRILGRESYFLETVHLGDLVDILVGFSDDIRLFSFCVGRRGLAIRVLPGRSYSAEVNRNLRAQVKALAPLEVRVEKMKQMPFLEHGKLNLLRCSR